MTLRDLQDEKRHLLARIELAGFAHKSTLRARTMLDLSAGRTGAVSQQPHPPTDGSLREIRQWH